MGDEPVQVKDEPEEVHEGQIQAQREQQSSRSQVPELNLETESLMPKSQEAEEAPKVEVSSEEPPKESSETAAALEAPKTPTANEMQLSAPDINIIPSTPLATSPNVVLQQEEEEEEKNEEEEKRKRRKRRKSLRRKR